VARRPRSASRKSGGNPSQRPARKVRSSAQEKLSGDADLARLAKSIVSSVGISPREVRSSILYPQLKVTTGRAARVNVDVRRNKDGTAAIVFSSAMYHFLRQYTRAIATFAALPGGELSEQWPAARSAMSSTVDWACAPASTSRFPDFAITPRQERRAQALLDPTLRFVLCHEMAHVMAGHLEEQEGWIEEVTIENLQAKQKMERIADQLGLTMLARSLSGSMPVADQLAGPLCFLESTSLLRLGLMLMADPDMPPAPGQREGPELRTHPPYLERILRLMGIAKEMYGDTAVSIMDEMHGNLSDLNGELIEQVQRQQDEVASEVAQIVNWEVQARYEACSPRNLRQPLALEPGVIDHLKRLLDRSPTGMLTTLRSLVRETSRRDTISHRELRHTIIRAISQEVLTPFRNWLLIHVTENDDTGSAT
jgi:hypothetical protein